MNSLYYQKRLSRNIGDKFFTSLSVICALIAILPLIFLVTYILYKGGSQITPELFTLEPNPPGDDLDAGGINPALIGTLIITTIASIIALPVGVGGGIYLAEYSKGGAFSRFIRFGVNVLAGVPSIIAGVFIYALIVSTKILFGSMYSGLAGGMALSILMLPTVIKTTDEGLKLVPNELRYASLGVGASMYTTILKITLPSAFRSIATGVVLGMARAAGETAPLIFTALIRTLIGLVPAIMLTSPLFGVSILKLGLPLLFLFLSLYLFGITLGLFVSSGLIRFGPSFENIAWSSLFLLAPLGCIYYPIEILPELFQFIAKGLPLVYIFDETRNILLNGSIDYTNLKQAYLLNLIYLIIGIVLFYLSFLRARIKGTLINMGE